MPDSRIGRWTLLRGCFAVLFGLFAFFWPGVQSPPFSALFGFYLSVNGVLALISSSERRSFHAMRSLFAIEGLVSIAAGLAFFAFPIVAPFTYLLAGGWGLLIGFLIVSFAVANRRITPFPILLGSVGACALAFGGVAVAWPSFSLGLFHFLLGAYALASGILQCSWGARLLVNEPVTDAPWRVSSAGARA